MGRRSWMAWAALALAWGCGSGEAPPVPPKEQEPPDETRRPHDLSGREIVTWRGADGEPTYAPLDLEQTIVQAHCPDGEGGWTILPGGGERDGSFAIEGLPAHECWIRRDRFDPSAEPVLRDEYVWTDAEELDLGFDLLGRADLSFPTKSTELRVRAGGLAAWDEDDDAIMVHVPNVDYVNFHYSDAQGTTVGMPTSAATSMDVTFRWRQLGAPLLDAARGDRVRVVQWRSDLNEQGVPYTAPLRGLELDPVDLPNGEVVEVEGELEPLPEVRYRMHWARGEFQALRADVHPNAESVAEKGFGVFAASESEDGEWFDRNGVAEALGIDDSAYTDGTTTLDLGEFVIGNPYGEGTLYDFHAFVFTVKVTLPKAYPNDLQGTVAVFSRDLPTADAPRRPLVTPVRNLTVDGRDARTPQEGVGLQPEIAWEPPRLGEASGYELYVLQPGLGDMMFNPAWMTRALLRVPGDVTSIRLPAQLLTPELPTVLVVRAISQPDHDVRAAPLRRKLPYAYADALSEVFFP